MQDSPCITTSLPDGFSFPPQFLWGATTRTRSTRGEVDSVRRVSGGRGDGPGSDPGERVVESRRICDDRMAVQREDVVEPGELGDASKLIAVYEP